MGFNSGFKGLTTLSDIDRIAFTTKHLHQFTYKFYLREIRHFEHHGHLSSLCNNLTRCEAQLLVVI